LDYLIKNIQSRLITATLQDLPIPEYSTLYQFMKVYQHFWDLKIKPSKDFQNTKWHSHFVFWYNCVHKSFINVSFDTNHLRRASHAANGEKL